MSSMRFLVLFLVSPLLFGAPDGRVAARPDARKVIAPAVLPPHFLINNQKDASITTCTTNLAIHAAGTTTLYGTWVYFWTLYRDGVPIATSNQQIQCSHGAPCQPPFFNANIPAVSGIYKVRLVVGPSQEWSHEIKVTASSNSPTAISKINGDATIDYVAVCPGGPIILDGSASPCAASYFASIELSDKYWNRKGDELAQWLGSTEQAKYGPINAFNIKKWAEDKWFKFVGGQYYRVKLAVGPGWNDRTQLIFITTPVPALKINGQGGQSIDIVGQATRSRLTALGAYVQPDISFRFSYPMPIGTVMALRQ